MRALEKGLSVRFSTLPTALADLLRQESLPATERRLHRYTTPDLLILDELATLYRFGNASIRKDVPRAAALHKRVCDADVAKACLPFDQMNQDEGLPREPGIRKRMVEKLPDACNAGDAESCRMLADVVSDPERKRAILMSSIELDKRSCNQGRDAMACSALGLGLVGDKKYLDAIPPLELACDAGGAGSCHLLGTLLHRGPPGVVVDRSKARTLFERACKRGDPEACRDLK